MVNCVKQKNRDNERFFLSVKRPEKESEIQIAEKTPIIYKVGNYEDDPEIAKLLSITREVLKSDTDYSIFRAANIRSFHWAIKTESRLNKIEEKVLKIEDKFKQAGRIRNNDPELEKGMILKKREM